MKRRDVLFTLPHGLAGAALLLSDAAWGKSDGKPERPLALRYLDKVRGMLRRIRESQSENLLEAAYQVAATVERGGQCWNHWDTGHSLGADMYPGRDGDPEIFRTGYDIAESRPGDLLLASIFDRPPEYYRDIQSKNIFLVGAPAPWGGDAQGQEFLREEVRAFKLRPLADIWIETNITTHGAIMELPGMPAPFGPVSGVIGMVTYWMIIADACRILARDGVSVPVKGSEPSITGGEADWRSIHKPLMDDYFDEIMRQMAMIEGELGNVRAIARMAADTALSGGTVHCYSRYRASLSVEATTRRGGLALTRGTHDGDEKFSGSASDCVIMGISRPDDPVDLAHLDIFKGLGMKTASIGPRTFQGGRWGSIRTPEGRSVPEETDLHAGAMCDTYGLFAIPGFEKKICPTSGVLLNQIFWATCMEIAEEIIRRTGNAPGVYLSAALKGGRPHMHRISELYRKRGY